MAGEDIDYGSARITIDLDDGNADSESRATGLRIQRALLRSTRRIGEQMRRQIQRGLSARTLSVRVEPDLSRFDAQLLTGLRSLDSLNIPVAPDVTGFEERLRALLAGIEIPIRVVPDLDGFDARIRAHRAPDVTVNVEPDVNRFRQALAGLSRIAATVGKGLAGLLKFGAVGIAAAGAASAVGSFTAAIAPAGGIVAALPAALLGAAAAMNVLKLGLQGVSDALGKALEGDMEKFSEELEKLARRAEGDPSSRSAPPGSSAGAPAVPVQAVRRGRAEGPEEPVSAEVGSEGNCGRVRQGGVCRAEVPCDALREDQPVRCLHRYSAGACRGHGGGRAGAPGVHERRGRGVPGVR
ncbi:hypothetical protein ACR6C2_07520 [Streptomyces sp. INA 01156]